jgi:hypothetical protein
MYDNAMDACGSCGSRENCQRRGAAGMDVDNIVLMLPEESQ